MILIHQPLAMAFSGLSISSSHILHNLTAIPSLPTKPPAPVWSSGSANKWWGTSAVAMGRRMLSFSVVGFLVTIELPLSRFLYLSRVLATEHVLELVRYTDSDQGFTLLVPSSWIKVDKAGATVLFEDPNKKANNVGVVVNPTRISSLDEFGNPEFVVDKLIQAERRKESTKEAKVISVSERSGHAGIKVYEFEYKLDSSRGGMKRVFSAAFVASKRLYLLNIIHSDALENPLDMERQMMLEQVLHSFDAFLST